MTAIDYPEDGEPGSAAVLNRPLREALTALGLDPDDVVAPWLTQAAAGALYAAIAHNHDAAYAAIAHDHDADYAAIAHDHDTDYAPLVHTHDNRYYTEAEVDALIAGVGGGGGGGGVTVVGHHAGTTDHEAWYAANTIAAAALTTFSVNNAANLWLVPFIAPARGGTLDKLAVNVTTLGSGANIRLSLYSSKGEANIYPDALLAEGTVSGASAGVKTLDVNVALSPGRIYWIGVQSDVTLSVSGIATGAALTLVGYSDTFSVRTNMRVSPAGGFGSNAPDPCPGSPTYLTGTLPGLFYRFSA